MEFLFLRSQWRRSERRHQRAETSRVARGRALRSGFADTRGDTRPRRRGRGVPLHGGPYVAEALAQFTFVQGDANAVERSRVADGRPVERFGDSMADDQGDLGGNPAQSGGPFEPAATNSVVIEQDRRNTILGQFLNRIKVISYQRVPSEDPGGGHNKGYVEFARTEYDNAFVHRSIKCKTLAMNLAEISTSR